MNTTLPRKWFSRIFKGASLATVAIAFQACYGAPRDFGMDQYIEGVVTNTEGEPLKDNFMDVWNNRYQLYRNRDWTKTGQCASCKEYKYCKGNGLHYWTEDRKNILACHCDLIK